MSFKEVLKATNVNTLSHADFAERFKYMEPELVRVKEESQNCWKLNLGTCVEVWAYRPSEARSDAHWERLEGAIIERGQH